MKDLWQASIYRPNDRSPETLQEAQDILGYLGPEWKVDSAEDLEAGVFLVRVPPDINARLDKGREYTRKLRDGWVLEIPQP